MNGNGIGDLFALNKKRNSQGEDPRTFKETVERWRVQKKRKEKKRKEKKKKKDKKIKRSTEEGVDGKSAKKGSRAFLQRRGKNKRKKRKAERVTNAPERDKSWRSL